MLFFWKLILKFCDCITLLVYSRGQRVNSHQCKLTRFSFRFCNPQKLLGSAEVTTSNSFFQRSRVFDGSECTFRKTRTVYK